MGLVFSYFTSDYEKRICTLEKIIGNFSGRIASLEAASKDAAASKRNSSLESRESPSPKARSGAFHFCDGVWFDNPRKVEEFKSSDEFDPAFAKSIEDNTDEELMKDQGFTTLHELEEYLDTHRIYFFEAKYEGATYHTTLKNKEEFEEFRKSFETWIKSGF